jgi:hypothetical protein
MRVRGSYPLIAAATIVPRGGMRMEMSELDRRQRAEYRRELHEQYERKKKLSGFKNGAEALQAFSDLFDSDEELEEFGDYLQQMREEERARYRG